MVAVLTPATSQILHENPSVTLRSFVDDRSWCAESAEGALRVNEAWADWSRALGLCENTGKSQFYHRTAKGHAKFLECGVPESMVTSSPCILGVCLTPATRRKCKAKERQRIDDSCRILALVFFRSRLIVR